jgi:hypothetical protein
VTDDEVLGLLPEDGSALPYATLAEKASLDRADLAHAMRRLYVQGLVWHQHNRGWRRKLS